MVDSRENEQMAHSKINRKFFYEILAPAPRNLRFQRKRISRSQQRALILHGSGTTQSAALRIGAWSGGPPCLRPWQARQQFRVMVCKTQADFILKKSQSGVSWLPLSAPQTFMSV